tara:strand:- start:28620 stop:29348 length:729 start_codon:yes stop_codon:yes gene_type:complete
MKKDNIYKAANFNALPFSFNKEVTEVFEDMIDRSVPGYRSSLKLIESFGKDYFQSKSSCYDLGCSVGASALSLLKAVGEKEGQIYAIDNSEAMILKCTKNFNNQIDTNKIDFIYQDIETIEIKNASIVVINFVLQFIDPSNREELLKKVFGGMKENALLILSEKIHFDNKYRNQTIFNLHHGFKLKNGYTKMEISRKRDALEGVLVTDSEKNHYERLNKIGFKEIKKVMSNLNFFTLVAQKK